MRSTQERLNTSASRAFADANSGRFRAGRESHPALDDLGHCYGHYLSRCGNDCVLGLSLSRTLGGTRHVRLLSAVAAVHFLFRFAVT
jgi:hypothetical protein